MAFEKAVEGNAVVNAMDMRAREHGQISARVRRRQGSSAERSRRLADCHRCRRGERPRSAFWRGKARLLGREARGGQGKGRARAGRREDPPRVQRTSRAVPERKTNTNLILRSHFHLSLPTRAHWHCAQQSSSRIAELPVRNPRLSLSSVTTTCAPSLITAASLPEGEGPSRFSPASVKDWHPRRKSVSNACERCRRRKIRCDGDTPCATCKRFSLPCIRTQKPREAIASEHQYALENRIHQLEAQLATHINAPMHGMESIDQSLMGTPPSLDWQSPPPQLTLDTNFPTPFSPGSELDLATFSAGSIPSIAITECEPTPNDSPESPVPSLWSGTTRGSSPDVPPTSAPQFPPSLSRHFSPPASLHTAPSWEFMGQEATRLKPNPPQSLERSRTSSISSSSIDSDDQAVSPFPDSEGDVDMMPLAPAPRLPRTGIFSASTESPPPGALQASYSDRSRAITSAAPWPSKFEAETLTTEFVQHIETFEHKPYAVAPPLFARFCSTVYPDPKNREQPADVGVSTQMVRFHVFLAMAVGMKVRILNTTEATNALLDRCYELAMQQASAPTFWQEAGGVEATQLLAVFASLKKEPGFENIRPLQPSFSW
ncbi:hypothetical protein EJ04DRAFT_519888 [Polyplosphaeria fusca]|uniref:Zn(2)-C6 fungal-type domain-containing protein n=1 Tax=Polyplosphaeria fusca TaxID=682080 RepID=A0A9P4V3X0_9PLEO|nr:hypothetical protein EJ04DRAFT_519888 [Polyplosphaeria fusca]